MKLLLKLVSEVVLELPTIFLRYFELKLLLFDCFQLLRQGILKVSPLFQHSQNLVFILLLRIYEKGQLDLSLRYYFSSETFVSITCNFTIKTT